MNIVEIIKKKIDKKQLTKEEIKYFIDGYTKGDITDYQAAAMVTAIMINGMDKEETYYMTEAMTYSGEVIKFDIDVLDKHSTGGVGDKVTLVFMPILACLGYKCGKMSGRGLGYTGGTVDKLESIPGFNMDLTKEQFIQNVEKYRLALVKQNDKLVPADKKIYALRDVIGCTESIPLITSSIVSKKIASGVKKVVIDITYGSGAFMKTKQDAEKLKEMIIYVGKRMNKDIVGSITSMETPLGYAVGNSLEIQEAIDFLNGKKIDDLRHVVIELTKELLDLTKEEAEEKIDKIIESKEGLKALLDMIKRQGGDIDAFNKRIEKTLDKENAIKVYSDKEGIIKKIDALSVAKASLMSGAGRLTKEEEIDYDSGILLNKKEGDYIKEGELLYYIFIGDIVKSKIDKEKMEEKVQNITEILKEGTIIA